MPKVKYQFGEIETTEGIPPVDTIAEKVEDNGIFGATGNQRGVPINSEVEDDYVVGEDYIFVRYIQEVEENRQEIKDGDIVFGSANIARFMRFLLTRGGSYAYESTAGVYDSDAVDYLIGDDAFEIGFDCNRYSRFTAEQMANFYDDAFRVRGLKLNDIGTRDADSSSVDSDVANYVGSAGESTVRAVFSTGQQDNDLSGPGIIDGFARLSDINYIRMRDAEGAIKEANKSGRYTISHPSDEDLEYQAEQVREAVASLREGLVSED